jgi:tRNA A-37 threonylcarbamoyl transferase component Bud32
MQLVWPSPQDYNEAVQNPKVAFVDLELQEGTPDLNQLGLPRPTTGSFASVYRMMCAEKSWAVRCFLKAVYDQELRYRRISQHLRNVRLNSTVNFEYQPDGIKFRGRHLPIIKMEWVDGVTLDNFINVAHGDAEAMMTLAEKFFQLYQELQKAGIAHGDLQHGNLMVGENGLKLVDYDGMYVPSLQSTTANELGHRNYQHPRRVSSDFAPYLDNFSAWVIMISLYSVGLDSSLWEALAGGEECLLFKQADFRTPASSMVFSLLAQHNNSEIRALSAFLAKLLEQPLSYIQPLERQLLPKLTGQANGDLSKYLAIIRQHEAQANGSGSQRLRTAVGARQESKSVTEHWSKSIPRSFEAQSQDFINGNYGEAATHYAKLLGYLSSKTISPTFLDKQAAKQAIGDLNLHIECFMFLGYCKIFLGDMEQALGHFRNGLILAKSNNQIIAAMRFLVCIATAQFAQGKTQAAIEEIRRAFPGQSDLKAAIKMELSGPLAKSIHLADFVYQLAVRDEGESARSFFDMALDSYSHLLGPKSLQVASCLQGRVACDIKFGIRLSDEQDLCDARDILLQQEGKSSKKLLAIILALVRLYVKSAVGQMHNNFFPGASAYMFKAISEVDKLEGNELPESDCKELLLRAVTVSSCNGDNALINATFKAVERVFADKVQLVKIYIECMNDWLELGNNADAELLLKKAFEELEGVPIGAITESEMQKLILSISRVLAHKTLRNRLLEWAAEP